MNKRGVVSLEEVLLFIVQIVLVGLCFLSLLSFVNTLAKGTLVEKNFISKDTALLMNTLYASPNVAQTSYLFEKIDLSKFAFTFENGKAGVADVPSEDNVKPLPQIYRFGEQKNIKIIHNDDESMSRFEFLNNGRSILIDKGLLLKDHDLFCNEPIKDLEISRVIIDPGHGGQQKGLVNGNRIESKLVLEYAKELDIELKNAGYTVDATRSQPSNYAIDEEVDRYQLFRNNFFKEKDYILSLHFGNYTPEKNYLIAYVSKDREDQFRSYLCNLFDVLGRIQVNNRDLYDSVIVIDYDATLIDRNSDYLILTHPNSVMLELGNLAHPSLLPKSIFAKNTTNILKRFTSE